MIDLNQAQRLYTYLKTDPEVFKGEHSVFTPQELVDKMLSRISDLTKDKKILVIFNLEFVISLVYVFGVNIQNITLYSNSPVKAKIAKRIGIRVLPNLEYLAMDFDVIAGNPPFKNKNEIGGASALWRKIVKISWNLLSDGGEIAMIAPTLPNTSNDLGSIFTQHQTTTVWTDVARYFPGVGSGFSAWIVTKTPKVSPTYFIDDDTYLTITNKPIPNDIESISVIDRFLNSPLNKFECLSSPEYLHTSVADGKNDEHLTSKKDDEHPYLLRRTSGDNYYIYGAVEPSDYHRPKVVFTFSGKPHYRYHSKNEPIGTIKFQSGHILVKNKIEGENLIHLFNTSLYRYAQQQLSSAGMTGRRFFEFPKLSLDKKWTEVELFAEFGLTTEEIAYVQANVK